MRLIGWIALDYFTDLFNRSSRDYREVSGKLSEMKLQDKIIQQEERIRTQSVLETVNQFFILIKKKLFFSSFILLGFSCRSR